VNEYKRVTEALLNSPVIHGFCYTQLTDVEQEINGQLTYDRKPKCDLKKIKEITILNRIKQNPCIHQLNTRVFVNIPLILRLFS
jgi:hypothetical protein